MTRRVSGRSRLIRGAGRTAIVVVLAAMAAGCGGAGEAADRTAPVPTTSAPRRASSAIEAPRSPIAEIATHGALLSEAPPASPTPAMISLPSVGAAAQILPVGIAADELDVPPTAAVAGWYRGGPVPGASEGSAVLAGHVDFNGRRGAFFRLADLRVGDPVEVTDAAGSTTSFLVTETHRYPKSELPTAELFRRDGPAVLTLITCGGEFRSAVGSYADNVVVRAAPVVG